MKMVEANKIPNMEVHCALAESTNYSTGSVFYFYYPFFENTMDLVLNKIRKEVAGREISIVTLTVPDSTMQKHKNWLKKGPQARDTENKFDHTRIFRSY
jgi:hypothetical protein